METTHPRRSQDRPMIQNGQNNVRLPHQHLGHLGVLSVGPVVYAFHPIDKKILWDKDLSSPGCGGQNTWMADGNGNLQIYPVDGFYQRPTPTPPTHPSYL